MPSVGMRRTTRVFGARVLRSGRRIWTGLTLRKRMRVADGENWTGLVDNSIDSRGDASQCKENGWHEDFGLKQEIAQKDIDENSVEPESGRTLGRGLVDQNNVDRMWGSVYQRKRRRVDSKISIFSGNSEKERVSEEGRYGKHFYRKQRKKRVGERTVHQTCDLKVLAVVVEAPSSGSFWLACFLNSVLRYMKRARVRLLQLSAFVLSEPISQVYSSHGIHFLRDSRLTKRSAVCKILGIRCFIPLFVVEFSAVPFCFMLLHSRLYLRSVYFNYLLASYPEDIDADDDKLTDVEEQPSCISSEGHQSRGIHLACGKDTPASKRVLQPAAAALKVVSRTQQSRNGVTFHSIQKRRSSLRVRRGRSSAVFGIQKTHGPLVSNLFSFRHDGGSISPVLSNRGFRSAVLGSSMPSVKEVKSSLVGLTQDFYSASCSANILVIDSDKCYREEGATITLEMSTSKQWFLAIKKDGVTRYSVKAQKVIRSYSCNRFTHAIIWTGDGGLKLEFPSRRDWLIFKELYKECSDRSVQVHTVSVIPVPGVHQVTRYADSNSVPFTQPPSYITLKDDEVTRALAKKTANYDMDSEDEDWLDKFNEESSALSGLHKDVSSESFELIIDSLERGFYCNPDDYSDEQVPANLCQELDRREVLQDVYSYWMRKRKQKRSALLRVFQCNQHKRPQLIPKPVMRKKRSFKQQASQAGRGKLRTFLQVMAAEQNVLEEQNAISKAEEAKAAAVRSEGVAVLKRQRAQLLMENADLATYRATIAVRIAEAARAAKSPDTLASLFIS